MALLTDRYGRQFPYLRLSLLDACNFRCSYCLPNGYRIHGAKPRWLQISEIRRLLEAFSAAGMRKVRLTGGEPTLRTDLCEIIAVAAGVPGVEKVALTSNGILVLRWLHAWRAAGLTSLNISVDSLDQARFHAITGHDCGAKILQGIELALASGLQSLKLNAVLLRELNDAELPDWLDYLRTRRLTVRFIELMQTGDNHDYFRRHHVRADGIERNLVNHGWQEQPRAPDAGPAHEYCHPDYAGRIGIIAPYSKDFCTGCNRLRVTATGDLRLCLFGDIGIPLRPLLQSDTQREELVALLRAQLGLKTKSHALLQGNTGLTPHLAAIGG